MTDAQFWSLIGVLVGMNFTFGWAMSAVAGRLRGIEQALRDRKG